MADKDEAQVNVDQSTKRATANVSNGDIDLLTHSRDVRNASYKEDPNVDRDVYPAPGQHVVQVLGKP